MRKPRLPAGRGAPRLVRLIALTATLAVALVLSAGAATRAATTSSTGLLGGEPLCESHHSLCRDAFKTPVTSTSATTSPPSRSGRLSRARRTT